MKYIFNNYNIIETIYVALNEIHKILTRVVKVI